MRRLSLSVVTLLVCGACSQEYSVSEGPPEVNPDEVTECPFSPISGTRFQRYDCNPVFAGSDEEWISGGVGSMSFHAEEVLGHTFYQMWYSTERQEGGYGLGYAISTDGTNWEPLEINPVHVAPESGWNRDSMGAVNVVWNSERAEYILAYQGVNYSTDANGMGILASPDGQSWYAEHDGDYFVNLSQPVQGVSYCWPLALTFEKGVGYQGYIGGTAGFDNVCEIYGYGGETVYSLKPENEQVLLPAGPAGSHDGMGIASAAVVKLDDTYYMFYVGFRDWEEVPGTNFISPYDRTLNLATSTDGVTWTKSPDNPILPVSLVTGPAVIGTVAAQVVGPRIHLWIGDYYEELDRSAIGYFLYEPDIEPHP